MFLRFFIRYISFMMRFSVLVIKLVAVDLLSPHFTRLMNTTLQQILSMARC